MVEPKFLSQKSSGAGDTAPEGAPLGGTREEAARRLQVGVGGLFAMILVMGVASAISSRAQVSEDLAVPDAAPTTEPTETAAPSDPLADAGVVPVVPTEGDGASEQEETDVPERTSVPDIGPSDDETRPSRNNAPPRN